jgi:hypothetical protein
MGHHADHLIVYANRLQVASAIQRVKAGDCQLGGVPDIVKDSRLNQHLGTSTSERSLTRGSPSPYSLGVEPPPRQSFP